MTTCVFPSQPAISMPPIVCFRPSFFSTQGAIPGISEPQTDSALAWSRLAPKLEGHGILRLSGWRNLLLRGQFDFSCGVTRPAWNGQANRRNKVIPLRDAPTYLAEWLPNGEWQKVDYAAHAVDDRTRDRQPSRSIRPYENSQSYEGFGPIVLAWASCVSYSHSTLIATCLLDCTLGPWSFPMVLQLR